MRSGRNVRNRLKTVVNGGLGPDALKSLERLETACRGNASQFLKEASLLFSSGAYPRAFFLAESGREELAKAQLAADLRKGHLTDTDFWPLFTSHTGKFSYLKRSVEGGEPEADPLSISVDLSAGAPEKLARELALYVHADKKTFEPSAPDSVVSRSDSEKAIRALNQLISDSNLLDLFGGADSGTAAALKRRYDPA
jgi:AbiV family abortive infection protein